MITHDDIPVLRFAARKALENGEITHGQYKIIMKYIEEMIQEKNNNIDLNKLNQVNRQLVQA